jgi:hypothetical protein
MWHSLARSGVVQLTIGNIVDYDEEDSVAIEGPA